MSNVYFIGDELSATGFRLGGARVFSPDAEEISSLFDHIRIDASLIVLTEDYARQLPSEQLHAAMADLSPLLVVVPDILGRTQTTDVSTSLRSQLGVLE